MMTHPVAATRLASFMLSRTHSYSSSVKSGRFCAFIHCVFAGDDSEAVHHVDVGAEVGDAIGDVKVEPGDDTHDRDQG